jgi:hypothetical protein
MVIIKPSFRRILLAYPELKSWDRIMRLNQIEPGKLAEARVDVMARFVDRLRTEDVDWLRANAPKEFVVKTLHLGMELQRLAANVGGNKC